MDFNDLKYLIKVNMRDFFGGYVAPFKVVVDFLAIPSEMIRQAVISLSMDSEAFEELQQLKLDEESEELVAKWSEEDEIIKNM